MQDRPGPVDLQRFQPLPTYEWDPERGHMPQNELVALATLSEAVRLIARTHVAQMHRPMYPANVSLERLQEASRTNPEVFSPYTIVEKDDEGNITTTPYHVAFRQHLLSVNSKLQDAAYFTRDSALREYLMTRGQSLLNGDYESSEKLWLTTEMTDIRLVIGPYDRYKDLKFNTKYSYGGLLGTLDAEETTKHQGIVEDLDAAFKSSDLNTTKADVHQRIRYDRTEIVGGIFASMNLTAESLPCQPEWRQKYGTEIIILEPSLYHKLYDRRLPLIREEGIVVPDRRRYQSDPEYRNAYGLRYDAHEAMHAWIRRPGDEQRFGKMYSFMSEMSATVIGLYMLRKIGLTNKQLEAVLTSEIAIAIDEYKAFQYENDKSREVYLLGEAVLINNLVKDGAIQITEKGEVTWVDITRAY